MYLKDRDFLNPSLSQRRYPLRFYATGEILNEKRRRFMSLFMVLYLKVISRDITKGLHLNTQTFDFYD